MDLEKYEKAVKLRGEIYSLQQNLEDLKGGYWDKVRIELKTGYSDMGQQLLNEKYSFISKNIQK